MKYLKILFVGILIIAQSCDSLLDVKTKHALPQNKVETKEGCESLIIGVYDLMQDAAYLGRDIICIPEVLSDNCMPSPSSTKYIGQYNFQPYHNMDIWESAYKQIGTLNEALFYLGNLDQTTKVQSLIGEALFLRAYTYFNIANIYSRSPKHLVNGFNLCVPLVTKPFFNKDGNIGSETLTPRNDVDAIWSQIKTDLDMSFKLLSNNDSGNAPNRITSLAVRAFQSRVFLYLEEWDNSIKAANDVIDKSQVRLYEGNYTDIFSKGTESLWQLHYNLNENLLSLSLHSAYGTVDNGKRDASGYGDGTGAGDAQLSVTPDFINLLDFSKDKRATALRKVHYYGQNLWWTTKFNSWGGTFGLDDIPIIRISEIYLNLAEAYAHIGNGTNARSTIDLYRSKRGLSVCNATNSELLNEILLQRRIELAFEGHRFFDLKRLGRDIAKSNGVSAIPYGDYRVVASISTKELDVNKNLVNNPGY